MRMIRKGAAVLAGSLLIAIGINLFFVPFRLLDGGVMGIALVLNYVLRLKVGLVVLLLSLPIFWLAWRRHRDYFFNSIYGLLVSSLAIDLVSVVARDWTGQLRLGPLAGAIVGGFLVGAGAGLMLKYKTSTGGTDLLAQVLAERLHLNVGFVIFVMDTIIITVGGFMLAGDSLILSMIAILAVAIATVMTIWSPSASVKQH